MSSFMRVCLCARNHPDNEELAQRISDKKGDESMTENRRAEIERRCGLDRRICRSPNYAGPERRGGESVGSARRITPFGRGMDPPGVSYRVAGDDGRAVRILGKVVCRPGREPYVIITARVFSFATGGPIVDHGIRRRFGHGGNDAGGRGCPI